MSAGKVVVAGGLVFAIFYGFWPVTNSQSPQPSSVPVERLVDIPRAAPVVAPKGAAAPAAVPLPRPRPQIEAQKRELPKTETILSPTAIAALIVLASRQAYYARGRPCACPEDTMPNGRRCGSNSAYSRPGGATPFCYPTDVSSAMIDAYRARKAVTATTAQRQE
jgi:hypothetical protein